MPLNGFDVSENNGYVDMFRTPHDHIFSLIKACEGASLHDSRFYQNYINAKSAGKVRGAYGFARPRTSNAEDEFNLLLSIVNASGGFELPPILDMEDDGGLSDSQLLAYIRTWGNLARQKTHYKKSILYSYTYFIKEHHLYGLDDLFILWLADYSNDPPNKIASWDRVHFRQYTETGYLPGISTHADLNVFNGTIDDLKSLCGEVSETLPQYDVYVKDNVYKAVAYNGKTHIIWTVLDEFNVPYKYKDNAVMSVNGKDIHGVIVGDDSYYPYDEILQGLKPHKVEWAFTQN